MYTCLFESSITLSSDRKIVAKLLASHPVTARRIRALERVIEKYEGRED